MIAPIPGTAKPHRLEENLGAINIELTTDDLHELADITSRINVQGARHSENAQKIINR